MQKKNKVKSSYRIGLKMLPIFLLLLVVSINCFATHNRAGEITYRSLGNLRYEAKIVTYTYTPSPADRPSLPLSWGDGTIDTVARTNQVYLPNEITRNEYVAVHTYSGPSTYIISVEDPNRNGGILNIPNSVNVPFYIESMLVINPFVGSNSSPVLLNPPIDNGCVGQPFIHNPAAYDSDGDSLAYHLVKCKGDAGLDIPNYIYPVGSKSFTLNQYTGDLYWDSPTQQGEFNVAIKIEEWRSGIMIGYVIRDMQISIVACNNVKPEITVVNDPCVVAGDTLTFLVKAHDPNSDKITLTSIGGVYLLTNSPATFPQATNYTNVSSPFKWITECGHIRKNPYNVIFKAQDNGSPVNLVDMKSLNITVVGPAPKKFLAATFGSAIQLSWAKYTCTNAVGFKIYRKVGTSSFAHSICQTGVPASTGFVEIADVKNIIQTSFVDDDNGKGLVHGLEYCYLIISYFADGSESYASEETCARLSDIYPVLTNVSITKTSTNIGTSYIAWSKPTEFDSIQYPGPYYYILYRTSSTSGTYSPVITLNGINDTTYIDNNINTNGNPIWYQVEMYSQLPTLSKMGVSEKASSVFLQTKPSDNKLTLTWSENVTWINTQYVIYKKNNATGLFDSIAITSVKTYVDSNLTNGREYCYYVKSIGSYNTPGFVNPIINLSQEKCDTPVDLEPPCAPKLKVAANCKKLQNELRWNNPNKSCANDVVSYKVYFSPNNDNKYTLLSNISSSIDTSYIHSNLSSIAGCYLVTAVDSFNNESTNAIPICVDIDSCVLYKLPNVFTPNGDGYNDKLIPYPYDYVDKIDLHIYNRWGNLVFKTTNPDILWDGKNYLTDLECTQGVYYYVCEVYERRLSGVHKRILTGVINLIR